MTLEELKEQLQLTDEQEELVKKFQQSAEDRIRTDYSKRLKDAQSELEKLKPVEKTEEQKEIERLKAELNTANFNKSLKDMGVSDDMAKYLRHDIDMTEFKTFYDGFRAKQSQGNDFVPNDTNINLGGGITKEQFSKMGIEERTKLYNTNPELYEQLRK